jgi:autotransporter-associated beta strand protein
MPTDRLLARPRSRKGLRIAALLAGVSLSAVSAHAQNATWNPNGTGDFNTGGNWTPATVPTGTASFGVSNQTNVTVSATTTIGSWTFNAGASNYNFTINGTQGITFNGAGIVLNGGTATINNNVLLEFSSSSTAGLATIINNGAEAGFSDSSTAGHATITNNGGTLDFQGSSTADRATIIVNGTGQNNGLRFSDASTAGNATISNNNLLFFIDNSTAGNAIINNNNQLRFQDNSTAGNAIINNNNQLTFLNSSTGGTARLINAAAGTVDISSLSSAGMTVGSIEGVGTIALGSKNLAVGGNNLTATFSGALQDGGQGEGTGGSLTKTGTGTLILTGNNNTYTGATVIDGGALIVNGSIQSSTLTTVNNGGTLAGTGTVGHTQINSGGTFAPGSGAPGLSITVLGNLAFQSGAIYGVGLNSTSTSSANVTGTARLGGTVQAGFALDTGNPAKSYDILHAAGGVGGIIFANLQTSNLPVGFTASLSYTATDVLLNVRANLAGVGGPGAEAPGVGAPGTSGPSVPVGLSQSEASVAAAINNFFSNGGTLPPGFSNLFNLTGSNLTNVLTLLSGEAATGAQQGAFQLMTEFMGLMLDPFVDGRAGVGGMYGRAMGFAPESEALPEDIALAYAKVLRTPVYKATPFEQRWSVWGGAYGGYNQTSGDPLVVGSHDLTASTAGVAAGMDYRVAPGTVVGFALAGGGTGWSLAQNLGSGRSDAFQAGVYGTTRSGPAYLAAALAYTEYWMSTDRLAFAGDHLTADFNAHSFGGRVEAGYRIPVAFWGLTPYAAVQAQNFHTPSYSEADVSGGGFGLTYDARNATDTRSELGARFDRLILLNWNAVLALRGKIAWAHDWITDPNLVPTFEALPGASFIVNGATPAKNSTLTSAGAELRLINGVSVLAKFDGEFASHSQTYGGTGTVRYIW